MTGDAPARATTDEYFDAMWDTGPDPWDHAGRFYEHRKYALTAAALQSERYEAIFEPGCATGLLTAMLAPRAERYLATDRHPRAVAVTRERVRGMENVTVAEGRLPADWPEATFTAIVFSEVLYYLEPQQVRDCLDRAAAATPAGGELIAVHFREPVAEHALLGDTVHDLLAEHPAWAREVEHRESRFVLEGFRRR